jgi:hypothetical protein
MADPFGVEAIGGVPLPRLTCTVGQITARAATRRTVDGVLGVIRLRGAVVTHRHGVALRCALPIRRGPAALIGAGGRRLAVPLSVGDTTDPPSNPRPDLALNDGDAIWGFAWLGSHCGTPARAVAVPLYHADRRWLRVALHGPQPGCASTSRASWLIDGVAGRPGQPVQPPRPEYSQLRLDGRIDAGSTTLGLGPIELTLFTTGTAPLVLDPCPVYAGRDDATAHPGGFSDPIESGHLPCTHHRVVIRPGHPLHWTIAAISFTQFGHRALAGSTVYVDIGIGGVPRLQLKTTAR